MTPKNKELCYYFIRRKIIIFDDIKQRKKALILFKK